VLSHSVSECQSDESVEFAIFCTELVAMATSLEISEKEVQIDHPHPKCFHSVKRLQKSVQRILRSFDSEKSLKKMRIKKEITEGKIYSLFGNLAERAKLMQAKYIAWWAMCRVG